MINHVLMHVKLFIFKYLKTKDGLFFHQGQGVSAKCRNAKVEDLWSLTSFFGYSTHTFVLAVNLLDRFLATIKVHMHTL